MTADSRRNETASLTTGCGKTARHINTQLIMNKDTNIFTITATLLAAAALLCSCSYNELPPKTDDATTDYILPAGTLPSADELATVRALKEEYENAIAQ